MTLFSVTYASTLNPCHDENVHTYPTTGKKGCAVNRKYMNQGNGIQMSLILENKLQK